MAIEYKLKYTGAEIDEKLEQVGTNKANITQLNEDIGNIGGTVEVTSGEPTKENTVVTISPSSETTNIYTAEEVDAKFEQMSEDIVDLKESVEFEVEGVLNNLYNSNYDITGYWVQGSGRLVESADCIYALIPIKPSSTVYIAYMDEKRFSASSLGGINLYNANNELVSTLAIENYESENTFEGCPYAVIPIPNTVTKLALTTKLITTWDARERLIVTYDDLSGEFTDGGTREVVKIDGAEIKDRKAREQIEILSKRKWVGKTWVCVGDSLTEENSRTTKNYHHYIAEETGITVVNMGQSGSGYKKKDDSSNAFYQRILTVPTNADVITIFGSFNDMSAGVEVGTVDDTETTTLAGAINTTIDNLFSVYPLARVGIVTPTPWNGNNEFNDKNADEAYVQIIIDICKKRGIPCLDLYHCSGLRPWEESYRALCYSKDDGNGVHPDETGHVLIAPRIKAFLETLIF